MAFKDIIGQNKAISILLRTIHRGRVPSSYLFAGESGIGKKLTAINLAKALNCLSGPQSREHEGIDACDNCSSCKKITAGTHPDFLFISPESDQIKIEEIRAIDDVLSMKAFEGKCKTVILDNADTLNQSAANAFLKTLEEPPGDSLIILISSNPERLPDTIRSRCSRINFAPLSLEACEEVIKQVTLATSEISGQKTGKSLKSKDCKPAMKLPDDTQLATLIRLSMGRPGEAISGDLIEDRAWSINLLKAMLSADKDNWASKEDMKKWFDFVLILLRDMAVMKICGDETLLINLDLKEYIKRLSSPMDLKVIIECYQRLNSLKGYFFYNLNKSLTWNLTGSLLRKEMDITNA
jgi:DNA polymerase III subunit delta'